ncbi:MAG: DinB family protein [Thermoanaerobaculia bacterium]
MKRFLGSLVLAACAAAATAQSLTPADRQTAIDYLEKTKKGVITATSGLSEAQWTFKSAPDRWSVAEVVEHIAAAEDFVRGNVEEQVLKAPARTQPADVAAIDVFVMQAVADRTKKVDAPGPLRPTNRFGSPEAALTHFTESREKTEKLLKTRPDLREHATDSPLGKQLDAYEWILFAGAHSERHTKQIEEVKADPNFPKK